jgi:hypothetical protein
MLPMTIADLRCDGCGRPLAGLAAGDGENEASGVRFVYHPGWVRLRDDSGLLCGRCWAETEAWMGEPALGPGPCPRCGEPAGDEPRLHVSRLSDLRTWQLCRRDAVGFLNRLRTVEPKLDPETFALPAPPPDASERM